MTGMKENRTHTKTYSRVTRGYVALMATIIISAILLVMTVEGSLAGWHARFNVLGTEAKEQASSLAQGCADQALSAIVTDPSYTGDATTTNDIGTCYIFPIQFNTPGAGIITLKAQANVRSSYSNLEMQIDMSEIHLDSTPSAPTEGTLVVISNVLNDGSGSKSASDFTINVPGGTPNSFGGDESGVIVVLSPGGYSVTGSNDADYKKTTSTNCSGVINSGDIKFCTITYDDIMTTLTILVSVTNDNGGTLTYADFPVSIDGSTVTVGSERTVTPGAHIVSAIAIPGYTASLWGFQCSGGGNITVDEGEQKTCIIHFDDNLPPAPSCADTVMILDRTGSMSSTDLGNERTAGNALTDLYASVLPPATLPRLGVGSIGAYPNASLPGGSAGIPLLGQLSTAYANIKSAIASITGSNSSVGSDLSAGINTANTELNSTRHVAGNEKVLILVSDGDPNEPNGTTNFDTGYRSPSAEADESATSKWTTPENAKLDGVGDASALVASSSRERYYDFNFGGGSGLPAGVTVTGIQAQLDAWSTALGSTTAQSLHAPSNTLAGGLWVNPTNGMQSNNVYTTSAVNAQIQGYSGFGFSIPTNATITGIQVTTEARATGGSGTPITTPTLFPNGQGIYSGWTNGEGAVDEIGTPDCSSADSLISNTNDARESVLIDVSGIPNGATVTDVNVTTYDRGDSSAGGTYRTFARLNGVDTDASTNLSATGNSGCNQKNQSINVPDVVKASGMTLEVGVRKINSNNAVRIGALRATVTYTPAGAGSITLALSSNNGGTWTSSKATNLTATEASASPAGNSASDLWGRAWTPSDFANGNFALRVENTSPTGVTASLDYVTVQVFYLVPGIISTQCQLGMDLSWNGGVSWTTEKTQNTTGTETAYTLGSASDDWSSSHTWAPAEFSNANFRTRVRAIDPGGGCDNTALEHLDWLRMRVHYSQNSNPVQAALNSADTAKIAGVDIFTIHFGSDVSGYNGRELLANLASGDTPVTGHENGSFTSTSTGVITGDSGLKSPSIGVAPSGFANSLNVILSDNTYATTTVANASQGYAGFDIAVPPTAGVAGISIEVEAKSADSSGCQLGAELSWDNGTTFTTSNQIMPLGGSDAIFTMGGATNLWGRTWSSGDFVDGKFVVRLRNIDPGNSCTNNSLLSVDRLRVRVYHSVNQENGDDDNFFISPTSADMKDIFEFIGEQVCPAIGFSSGSTPPTTGKVTVVTRIINNNGGTLIPSGVNIDVTPHSASPNTFAGSTGGTVVTLSPGAYNMKSASVPNGYEEVIGAGCSSTEGGNINAGESRICVLTYDDVPPPPPAPDLSIHLGSWKEIPTAN